jgi:hypothetical protein
VTVDRPGQLRWFRLDGVEHTGGADDRLRRRGRADDRITDTDGNGLADRAVCASELGRSATARPLRQKPYEKVSLSRSMCAV